MATTSDTHIEDSRQANLKAPGRIAQFFKDLKTRFTPPEGEEVIWWLVRVQAAWPRQLAAIIGFVIIFKLCGFEWIGAAVMLFSIYFHELGHGLLFKLGKIKIKLMFLFPIGAAAIPSTKEENKRSDELPWNFLSYLLFAGPTANAVLMFVGHILKSVSPEPFIQTLGNNLIFINGILGISNLLPIWKLDGGQYFKLIYSSLNEPHDKHMSIAFAVGAMALVAVVLGVPALQTGMFDSIRVLPALISNIGWVVFAFLFATFNLYSQGRDNPEHATSPLRITRSQIMTTLFCYFILTASMLFMV